MSLSQSDTNKARRNRHLTSNAVMASTTDAAAAFLERLHRILSRNDFADDELFAIHAAVNETLMNAIQLGNQSKPERQVHVLFSITASDFSIRIRDEGETILPDCNATADDGGCLAERRVTPARPNGRGNIVTMVFRRRRLVR